MADIFEFWSRIEHGAHIHPADVEAFNRMDAKRHGFQLECLPGCFTGKLKTAPIVLLYLSPGFSQFDLADARSKEGKDYRFRSWRGDEPSRDHGAGYTWLASRTKLFCDYEVVKQNFAVLNIGAYHSKDVKSYSSLLALPFSRLSLAWAQEVLFPDAEAGRRVVVCMRSAAYWGLDVGRKYKGTLFAPSVNRGGYLIRNPERERLIAVVKSRLPNA
ncbi:hypothetical protein [Bradyrhizobium sp. Leo121]|uniref:hypothetical protein n=1 Tax=Bradyrhizobium sp. Leo121 TaxID=1571195 RepID=UPI00102A04CB|nr:hypothetical protein [Bradyrhizobium sp. Leo121]RZN20107.1 hypothetical protein CWO90_34330 [Bradyrhizobium sp. Leo121]